MPTPLNPTDKDNFINLVRLAPYPGGPNEADRLQDILNNYEDVYTAITRELPLFESNNAYLIKCITQLDQLNLQSVGIWVNQTVASSPLADPVLIINSTYAVVELTQNATSLCILGNSYIGDIQLDEGVTLDELYIGPSVTVDIMDSSIVVVSPPNSPPTYVGRIYLPFAKSLPSKLNTIYYESQFGQILVDPGSYFGGVQTDNPDLSCAEMVSGVSATEITKNSVLVSWTVPATYLFLKIDYRKTGSNVWLPANEAVGDYQPNDAGFTFRDLASDTFYDVRIGTQCISGGWAYNTVTFQTTCCGAGTMMSLYKNCQIVMLISSTPDSPPSGQVLCNGVSIDLHYSPGTTITIPYLASVNCAVITDMVIDNNPFQLMPFNKATGTWDASTTSVHGFNEGSVVTIGMSLPA